MPAPLVRTHVPGIYTRGSRFTFSFRVLGKQRWRTAATLEEAIRLKTEFVTAAQRKRDARRLRVVAEEHPLPGHCVDCSEPLGFKQARSGARCADCLRVYRREMAKRAADAWSVLASERRLLNTEAELAALQQQRQRTRRAARQLIDSGSPSEKAIGESYTLILKLLQTVDRGTRAAEGMRAVRLRAAFQSLYEAEDAIKLAVLGDETEKRGGFRAA